MITREQALQWAKEAGAAIQQPAPESTTQWRKFYALYDDELVRFAALVEQHVREQDAKDAERYRWLRNSASWPWVRDNLWQPVGCVEFDAAIDDAIRAQNEGDASAKDPD